MEDKNNLLAFLQNSKLSDTTKKVYNERIQTWVKDTNKDIDWIMKNPASCLKTLKTKHGENEQTNKSYISAILAVFRYNPEFKKTNKNHYDTWYESFQSLHGIIEDRYKNNMISERQRDGYVEFNEICKVRDTLMKGSIDRLLLSMYTYIPPLRADFNKLLIIEKKDDVKNIPKEYPNYLILDDTPCLVLREFKTKAKWEQYEKILPKDLVEEILLSLLKFPRKFLFLDRTGNPYSPHGYTLFVNRTLKRLFKKPLTISLIRHSFINSLDFNNLTVKEREDIALSMAHSVGTQDRYRLIFKTNEPYPAQCKCQCET